MIGVFGSSGFVGRNVVQHFAETNQTFLPIDRVASPDLNSNTHIVDFSDVNSYAPILERLDCALLLVSASVPGTFANDPHQEVLQNVLPYSRFLDAIAKTNVRKVIYLSSGGAVYGIPETGLVSEDHPTNPISPYGMGKLLIENLIKSYSVGANWDYTILRPSNPVGRWQSAQKGQGFLANAIDAGLNQKPLQIFGDGSVVRDYFDVRDLCSAISRCIESEKANNQVFNVGAGSGLSLLQVVDKINFIFGREINIQLTEARSIDVPVNVLSTDKLRAKTDWYSAFSLEDAIRSMLEFHTPKT